MKKVQNQGVIEPYKVSQEDIELFEYTPEEVAIIEEAENYSRLAQFIPGTEAEYKAFVDKFNKYFSENDALTAFNKIGEIGKTDPEFINQMYAITIILDAAEVEKAPTTEKVSVDSIRKLQKSIASAEEEAKLDALLADAKKKK